MHRATLVGGWKPTSTPRPGQARRTPDPRDPAASAGAGLCLTPAGPSPAVQHDLQDCLHKSSQGHHRTPLAPSPAVLSRTKNTAGGLRQTEAHHPMVDGQTAGADGPVSAHGSCTHLFHHHPVLARARGGGAGQGPALSEAVLWWQTLRTGDISNPWLQKRQVPEADRRPGKSSMRAEPAGSREPQDLSAEVTFRLRLDR